MAAWLVSSTPSAQTHTFALFLPRLPSRASSASGFRERSVAMSIKAQITEERRARAAHLRPIGSSLLINDRDLSERASAFLFTLPACYFPGPRSSFDSSRRLLSSPSSPPPAQARALRSDRAPGSSPLSRFLDHFPAAPSVPLALTLEKRSPEIYGISARGRIRLTISRV